MGILSRASRLVRARIRSPWPGAKHLGKSSTARASTTTEAGRQAQIARATGGAGYGGLTAGGMMSTNGLGLAGTDKAANSFFVPTIIGTPSDLEVAYVQSWALGNVCDMPAEDAIQRWRQYDDDDGKFEDIEERWNYRHVFRDAIRTARIFGTSLVLIRTTDRDWSKPLIPERMAAGSLTGFTIVDRYDAKVYEVQKDMTDPEIDWGKPISYEFWPGSDQKQIVHASRVMRFDGVSMPSSTGWRSYHQEWGISPMVSAISTVVQEQMTASAGAHLTQEASIPLMKVEHWNDWVAGEAEPEDDPSQSAGMMAWLKGIYHVMFVDKKTEFERHNYSFAGLPQLMNSQAIRVAAAAKIPVTKMFGREPAGMSATGESDLKNYALQVKNVQDNATPELRKGDMAIARDAGMDAPPRRDGMAVACRPE